MHANGSRHVARKRFGQNFLVDRNYIDRIVAAIDPKPGDNLVEIGPGLGALTRPLLERAGRLTVIEIDRDLASRLTAEFDAQRFVLHNVDALDFDFSTLGRDLRVIGNLPYNISTPLLFHLAQYESILRDLTVMLQKEVVQRMVAAPSTPEYGRLSVMLQARFSIERLFVLPPGAFRPAPKVESAVARLIPLREKRPPIADEALFARVVAAAFGQRRKTLRNALKTLASEDQLDTAGIAAGARGETLSVSEFARLANSLACRVTQQDNS
ncbi:MAG TPA: 16S rRNA (adenine(1518)-N(6)/adenine(1519)-N(6))-dimethyltransferase RsmA [Casimicrobiaceae bacterium]|nr:16S rRNA (adenine(1518)-N(6)/adenine(1519)-N(6))-dimethyltransferase RsmA [Casimicrobiaceae bacterium]